MYVDVGVEKILKVKTVVIGIVGIEIWNWIYCGLSSWEENQEFKDNMTIYLVQGQSGLHEINQKFSEACE